MCGITGIISRNSIDQYVLVEMNSLIRHRGPDDEGYVFFSQAKPICLGGKDTPSDAYATTIDYRPRHSVQEFEVKDCHLAFGHRRLSIVDLSPLGHQPMSYADGRYWITYNGEVYNHLELRVELEAAGYRFISHTDTEVILAAYDYWGEECLSRFNGMWSFAIYDVKASSLFFARDRFGVKPFYYWCAPDGALCFGSEIKQFTAYPGWQALVNGQRAYDYLVWGLTDHTHETMFRDVYQLRPGHSVKLNLANWHEELKEGQLPVKKWYELTARPFKGSFVDAAEEFKRHFTESVRLRLRADVPVGSCLSGGLDSSSIVCVANELLREQGAHTQQKTFSACAEIKRFDERQWIDEVVRKTAVDAHYVYPSLEKLFEESPRITWHQDEPYGSTSIYAQWNVFRLAADNGVKVMLDGQGADEYLAGYHSYIAPRLAGLLRRGEWRTLWREIQLTKERHGYSELRLAAYIADILLPHQVKDPLKRFSGRAHISPKWLNLKRLGAVPMNSSEVLAGKQDFDMVQSMSRMQLTTTNLQKLLHWEDRNSMAHSIEARVPFLDYRLVEFVLGMPAEYKISAGITKRLLRSGMSNFLPDVIRDRVDKLGFVTPEETWLKEMQSDIFRRKLKDSIDRCRGIVDNQALVNFDAIVAGNKAFNHEPWRLICFAEWMNCFSVEI